MKLTKKLLPMAVSAAIAAPMMFGATVAQADVSATLSASNMYLWRGQNISNPSPAFSGSLDYSNSSGLYVGAWGSSEGPFDGSSEIDLYIGYGGSFGDFGYDISYWKYLYPSADFGGGVNSLGDTDLSDVVLGLSYGPVAFTSYIGVESGSTKDRYYTLSGDIGQFTLLYGLYQSRGTADGMDYKHFQVSYAFNDEISFTVSKASDDGYGIGAASRSTVFEEDPLFQVSYSKTFDMK